MTRPGLYLSASHPLAGVAAAHCAGHAEPLVGGVACGRCWERAIRDDERCALEEELPAEPQRDDQLVDLVAVERACVGHRVALTPTETAYAIHRMRADGHGVGDITRDLGVSERLVRTVLARAHRGGVAA